MWHLLNFFTLSKGKIYLFQISGHTSTVYFVIWCFKISSRKLSSNMTNLHVVDFSLENFAYLLILYASDSDSTLTETNFL